MSDSVVMALDAGTTSIRAILFDHDGQVVVEAAQEFPQIYPQAGWVEHNPLDIWNTQVTVAKEALARAGLSARDVAASPGSTLGSAWPGSSLVIGFLGAASGWEGLIIDIKTAPRPAWRNPSGNQPLLSAASPCRRHRARRWRWR